MAALDDEGYDLLVAEFGESLVHVSGAGVSTTVVGLVSPKRHRSEQTPAGGEVRYTARIWVPAATVAAVAVKDRFTVGGLTWVVNGWREAGTGWDCECSRVARVEWGGTGFRRE